jgi:hypothetical protein
MENISSPTELKNAIQILEAEQTVQLIEIKDHFYHIYESFKPVNLIENTLKEINASPYLANNLLVATVGLVTGYLSKKAIIRQSDSNLRKLFGFILQFGVTNLVAQNPETIKSLGQYIFQHIFRKKETNYTKP